MTTTKILKSIAVSVVLFTLSQQSSFLFAQGTAFTYQGRLIDGANPANGIYDLRFALYDSGGTVQFGALTNSATVVSNGLFTVSLDFGNQFPGDGRLLELGVRSNGIASFTRLSPRQPLTPTPYAITASNLSGMVPLSQLAASVVTNNESAVSLTGTFGGNFGYFSNLFLSALPNGFANRLRFSDTPGSEDILLHAKRDLDFETENDGTAWVGHDYNVAIDHNNVFHVKNDSTTTIDHNLTSTVGASLSESVGGALAANIGSSMNLTVGSSLTANVGTDFSTFVGGDFGLTEYNNMNLSVAKNFTTSIGTSATSTIGSSFSLTVGNNFPLTVGKDLTLGVGRYVAITPVAGVGIGTSNPQGSLHVFSDNNPTVVRVQSSGTPGFGRLEFVSNPQGDVNEWRPGFIQSLDAGGFTGGLGFYVNGTGSGNKFATNEVMRVQNGRVGINTPAPQTALDVNGEIHWGASNVLSVNQTGSIELGNPAAVGTIPFIDFHYGVGAAQDYNTRIINSGDQQLDIARSGSSTPMARFNSGGLTVNGTFVSVSDRNAKENLQPVDAREVLNKVAALPVSRWNYKEDKSQRHLGPMAQDFYAAFGVGPDDKHIAVVDEGGVALAAIQGLNQKLETRSQQLEAENAELKVQLAEIKTLLQEIKSVSSK